MMTLPPNSYPAEIGVWLSVTASNPWTTVLDFFQGGTIRAGRVPLCVPLLRSLGRPPPVITPFRTFGDSWPIKSANPTGLVCLGQALNSLELTSPG